MLRNCRKRGVFVKNIWNQRLILFQSESDILEAEKQISDQYQSSLQFMIPLRPDGSSLDIVQSAYSITQAWKPFLDYGCTSEELRTILQCNALVCSLMAFEYLSWPDVDVSKKLPEISKGFDIPPATIKDLIRDIRTQKKKADGNQSNAYANYFNNCLLNMISQSDLTANPIFLPVIGALLLNREHKRRIDKDFRSLCRASYTYSPESNDFDELLRKQQSRLNASYDRFYNTLRDIVMSVPVSEDRAAKARTEFLKELIFHHRALSRCERDLSALTVRGNISFERQVNTILTALQYRCKIPVVFGADSFSFPEGKPMHALGQYYDFITLTAVSYYEKAHRNIEEAYNLILQCLNNYSFCEFLESEMNHKTLSENPNRRDDKNIPGKHYAQRAQIVVDCFSPRDYYGNPNCEYTMTQDELLAICTDQSHLCQSNDTATSNLRKMQCFDPDVGLFVVTFNCKKDKEDALAYPSILKSFLKQNFELKSNEIVFVDPE